uniref:hypothetical protein n=1 Tax=Polynucleobacter sp. TaxID=2029855 RepID=UPI00404898B3
MDYYMGKKSVPSVPSDLGDGNNVSSPDNQTVNALYKYDFVINNYSEEEVCQVKETILKLAKKGGFGKEVGESGTPHLQGAIWLNKKMRITSLAKESGFARASFRAIRNDEAMIKYIQKDGDAWTYKFPKEIKIITELYPWQKKIEELCLTEPDDRTINWYWEDTGNVGKSAFCKYMVVKYKALYCCGGKLSDIINLVFNCNMDETSVVIFDIPRATQGKVSYSALESIKNGLVCNTKYETGVKVFNAPHIICFANFPPEEPEKLSDDRWVIEEL